MEKIVVELVEQGSKEFLSGGIGDWDDICSSAVRRAKRNYPHIQLCLVIPYMSQSINRHKDYFEDMYDKIILPEWADTVHYKAAITMRNRWMIDKSGIMLAFVKRDCGGAYKAMKYAQKQGIKVLNFNEI